MKKLVLCGIFMALALMFAGCVCEHTHVPGRTLGHSDNPDSTDAFFCVLDYLLFTPDGELRSEDTRDEQIRREQDARRRQEYRERHRR